MQHEQQQTKQKEKELLITLNKLVCNLCVYMCLYVLSCT